ncbi:MAG: hypothetical protein IKH75_06425 [Ruminococcus sp.]|nr:hypothetical protein [Ruminococcus sp.]
MLLKARSERDYFVAFIIAISISFIVNILSQFSWFPLCIHSAASFLYSFIIIAWGAAVAQRIVHKRIRRHIVMIAVSLLMLFVVRICRWMLFLHSALAERYTYYLFYIPFIALPMLSLSAAEYVSRDEQVDMPLYIKLFWGVTGLLMLSVITNDIHHFVLSFTKASDNSEHTIYYWLYYVIFAWSFTVTLGSFFMLIKKCKLSQCRRKWYIPIIPASAALVLIIVYYLCGGSSPHLVGISIYNIQEIYLFLYMGLWEGFIRIGLIPSNTGYNRLFEITHINAEMKSADGKTAYYSVDYSDTEGNEDYNRKTYAIKGGSVTWSEDISAINRLNHDIEDATEQIDGENDLIEAENRFLAEKSIYETQNRLYDKIARHTHPQLVRIDNIMNGSGELEQKMKLSLLFGTYVKRCSNLMLAADNCRTMSTKELYLSVRESLEQIQALGIVCELINGDAREISSGKLITAYDVFEAVIESVIDTASTLSVRISPDETVLLSIETDGEVNTDSIRIQNTGLKLMSHSEDDIQHIALSAGGEVNG